MSVAVPVGQRTSRSSSAAPARSAPKRQSRKGPAAAAPDDLFCDGKEAGALRTIGEVARALGLRQHVLRYWEEQFAMLRPLTRAGGRRYYRPEDIALLIDIDRLLHREGYTIRGALQALTKPATRRKAAGGDAPEVDSQSSEAQAGNPDFGPAPEAALMLALGVLRQHLESIRDRLARELVQA